MKNYPLSPYTEIRTGYKVVSYKHLCFCYVYVTVLHTSNECLNGHALCLKGAHS